MDKSKLTEKEWARVDELTDQDFSMQEAIDIVLADRAIDKGEKLFELSAELEAGAKKARRADGRKNTRKPNDDKRTIMEILADAIANTDEVTSLNIENVERIFNFTYKGTQYRVTLSAPRK